MAKGKKAGKVLLYYVPNWEKSYEEVRVIKNKDGTYLVEIYRGGKPPKEQK